MSSEQIHRQIAIALKHLENKEYWHARDAFLAGLAYGDDINCLMGLHNHYSSYELNLEKVIFYNEKLFHLYDEPRALNMLAAAHLKLWNVQWVWHYLKMALGHPKLSEHDRHEAIHVQAFAKLRLGDYPSGFEDFEHRFIFTPGLPQRYTNALPSGNDFRGKSILVIPEQGLGDRFQFYRYLPMLQSTGATVKVITMEQECALLSRNFPGLQAVVGDPSTHVEADYRVKLMSLAHYNQSTIHTIPGGDGYLKADPERVGRWAELIGRSNRKKIGFVWAGNRQFNQDAERSIALKEYLPLLSRTEFDWFCIQKEVDAHDQEWLASSAPHVRVLGQQIASWDDTMAIIENLDLVIAVDTSVAHLAGALGKKTFLINRFSSDWRWLYQSATSPWYRSVHIFQQPVRGDWGTVISRVAEKLSDSWHLINRFAKTQ